MRTVWLGPGVIDFRWVVASTESLCYAVDYALEYEFCVEGPETGPTNGLDWSQRSRSQVKALDELPEAVQDRFPGQTETVEAIVMAAGVAP